MIFYSDYKENFISLGTLVPAGLMQIISSQGYRTICSFISGISIIKNWVHTHHPISTSAIKKHAKPCRYPPG